MKTPIARAALSLMLFSSPLAFAQTPVPVPPAATPQAEAPPLSGDVLTPPPDTGVAPEAPPSPSPPPEVTPPAETAAPAPPAVQERLDGIDAKIDGINESLAATKSATDRLSKLRFGGFIQSRYEWHADSANGLNAAGRPADTDRFYVKRARLKTTYDGTNAEYMLQLDASGDGVVLKDAEATFIDTWSPFGLRLTVGQFLLPFGYEVLQSDADREMPERSLVIRSQIPGERDRGLRIQGKYEQLRFAAALVNGNSIQDPIYGSTDQNAFKDIDVRVGGDLEWLVFGVSGYWGETLQTPALPAAATLTWTDKNMDKLITVDELVATAAKAASYRRFTVGRLGLDAQAYFDIPQVGGLAVKGEFVFAKLGNLDPGAIDATSAVQIPKSCYDITSIGWILTVVQNVGDYVGAVVRVDSYDPNYSKSLDAGCPASFTAAGQGDRKLTTGGGLLIYGSANIKGTFTYEHLSEQSKPVANDIFTAQLQARF